MADVSFNLNGRPMSYDGPPTTPLIQVLRESCGDTSVKLACSRAVCGSCTVLIDGVPGASCALFAYHADGAKVLTAAGLSAPHPIAEAFADHAAFQCGYCTAGMLMLTKALLDRDPDPDRETVVQWISSNICRCTGYAMIVDAVLDAARRLRGAADV
jgi:carbon-monoxide dehydrogenase small subunit